MNKAELLVAHCLKCTELQIKLTGNITPVTMKQALKMVKIAMKEGYHAGREEGREGRFSNVVNGYSNFDEWFDQPFKKEVYDILSFTI